jgi:putative transposase
MVHLFIGTNTIKTMNKYNPTIHHRRSIRLKGYDYAQAGLYFITICCQRRGNSAWLPFGEIENGEMILNDAGMMVEKWYYELENKFADIKCHEMIVMPNHFHCIVENVGADLRVCPNSISKTGADISDGGNTNTDISDGGNTNTDISDGGNTHYIEGEHIGSPLHRVVQWFKTMTTNEYIRGVKTLGWQPFDGKLWQRNYWEHIIRDEQSYQRISEYIIKNPAKWADDKFYT